MSVADGLDRWATAHARTVGGTIGAATPGAGREAALDLSTFRQVGSVPCEDTRMHGFAITTTVDGRVLLATCDDDHSITVHDLAGAGDRVVLRGHGARINAMAWLEPSDGHERLVSGDTQGGVWLWDVGGGPSRRLPVTEARAVRAVAWTRMPGGGTRLALSRVDAIEVWDPGDPDGATCIGIAPGHRESTWAVRWFRRPGDAVPTLVTGGYDGTVRTWRPDLDELAVVQCADGGVGDVAFVEGADRTMWAVVTCFTSIDVWDLTAGRLVRTLADDAGGAQAAAALRLPDDRLVAVTNGDEGVARVWDIETGEVVAALEHPAEIRDSVGFAVLPDGRLLLAVACDNGEAYLWETDPPVAGSATGERLAPLTELSFTLDREFHHGGHTLSACLGRVGERPVVATTGLDGQVKVWDVGSGERRYTLDDHGAPTYTAAAIQHEGEMLLATGAEGSGNVRQELLMGEPDTAVVLESDAAFAFPLQRQEPVWLLWAGAPPAVDRQLPPDAAAALAEVDRLVTPKPLPPPPPPPPPPSTRFGRLRERLRESFSTPPPAPPPRTWHDDARDAELADDFARAAGLFERHGELLRAAHMYELAARRAAETQ